MRSIAVCVLMLSACGFHPSGLGGDPDSGSDDATAVDSSAGDPDAPGPIDAAAVDAAATDAADPTIDATAAIDAAGVDADGDPFCTGTGLVACFRMNQAPGAPIDGAAPPLGAAVGTGANYVAGCHGTALDLGAGVTVRTNEPSPNLARVTVAAWVKLDAAPAIGSGRHYWFDSDNEWGLYFDPRIDGKIDVTCQVIQGTGRFPWVTAALSNPTAWNHVACSFDGAKIRLFLNGQKTEADPSDGEVWSASTQGVQIGRDGVDQAGGFVDGLIDDVRIWNRRVPDNELQAAAADACQ